MKVCSFFVDVVVTLYVSELHNKTAFTLVFKILILVAVHRSLLLQTELILAKACCAFFLLAIMPPSVPLVLNSSTSSAYG